MFISMSDRTGLERREAAVAYFSVGEKYAHVMFCSGFNRTMLKDVWRKGNTLENREKLTIERKAHTGWSSAVRIDKLLTASRRPSTAMNARTTLRWPMTWPATIDNLPEDQAGY